MYKGTGRLKAGLYISERQIKYFYFTYICTFLVTDLHGYVIGLLGVQGAIFNLLPIAQVLNIPAEVVNRIIKLWKDDDQQMELILQHWLEKNSAEELTALRKAMEGLEQG